MVEWKGRFAGLDGNVDDKDEHNYKKDKEDEDGVVDKDDKHHVVDRHHHKGHHQQYCSKMRKSVPAQGSLPDSSMTYLNHSSY